MTQLAATAWINSTLRLTVHQRNNIVIPARRGLLFLGHKVYPHSPLSVDSTMLHKLNDQLNEHNASSYQALALPRRYRKQLAWKLEVTKHRHLL